MRIGTKPSKLWSNFEFTGIRKNPDSLISYIYQIKETEKKKKKSTINRRKQKSGTWGSIFLVIVLIVIVVLFVFIILLHVLYNRFILELNRNIKEMTYDIQKSSICRHVIKEYLKLLLGLLLSGRDQVGYFRLGGISLNNGTRRHGCLVWDNEESQLRELVLGIEK